MFGLLKSVTDLTKDVIDIATAPVEIAVDSARIITKPIAEASKEVVKEIKKSTEER